MSKSSLEKSEMSEIAWASNALQERIAPVGSSQFVETRIRKAATALGWKFSRARTVWYGDERVSIKPRELRRIEEVAGIHYGREEIRDVDALISSADALLMGVNSDFYSAFAAALRAVAGAVDRSRASKRDR